jgi:hypothetical protein
LIIILNKNKIQHIQQERYLFDIVGISFKA